MLVTSREMRGVRFRALHTLNGKGLVGAMARLLCCVFYKEFPSKIAHPQMNINMHQQTRRGNLIKYVEGWRGILYL